MAMKISLGPIPYLWEREKVFDFYKDIRLAPIDIVYLGETICSKRRELSLEDWLKIACQLNESGKEVVFSTLTLIEAMSELSFQNRIIKESDYKIEANDMAAINQCGEKKSFVLGPHINVYNSHSLGLFADMGACRWVVPIELGRNAIEKINQHSSNRLETEMLAFGNLPLAFSARCYTARAHNRPKDKCNFICKEYPDGLPMFTQENEPFLILNGIQTQSAAKQNLVTAISELQDAGIDIIRIMPQAQGMHEIIDAFYNVIKKTINTENALSRLEPYIAYGQCNGYWYGKEGMSWVNKNEKING